MLGTSSPHEGLQVLEVFDSSLTLYWTGLIGNHRDASDD